MPQPHIAHFLFQAMGTVHIVSTSKYRSIAAHPCALDSIDTLIGYVTGITKIAREAREAQSLGLKLNHKSPSPYEAQTPIWPQHIANMPA